MEELKTLVDSVSEQLSSVANSDVVVGSPLELGGVTVVPISRVSLGLGAGGGEGEGPAEGSGKKHGGSGSGKRGSAGKGSGGATGGAGKIRPVAVVVLGAEGVEVLPIDERTGRLDKLLDRIPELVERFKDM